MSGTKIMTERLDLLAGSVELSRAEISDRERFAELLGARVPPAWPPPFNDEASMEWSARIHEANGAAVGWGGWYFLLRDDRSNARTAIGGGGFKGPPTPEGTVEIGYSLLEEHQGKGYGTEAVLAIVAWAFEHPEVRRVIAETSPELGSSIRLLEKCRFRLVGPGSEAGSLLYELPRDAFRPHGSRPSAPPQ